MTHLLVSVRSAAEAMAALAGGATIIDVKEPVRGSLGQADESIWREVIRAVAASQPRSAAEIPVSVALGELRDFAGKAVYFPPGVTFAKLGLAGKRSNTAWPLQWLEWRAALPIGVDAVAVAYADALSVQAPEPEDVLQVAAAAGVKTLLLDTGDKLNGSLLEVVTFGWLNEFAVQVRRSGMNFAVAGSLQLEDISPVMQVRPEIIAVRSAACVEGRTSAVSSERVRALVQAMASSSGGSLPGNNVNPANDRKTISIDHEAG